MGMGVAVSRKDDKYLRGQGEIGKRRHRHAIRPRDEVGA
jgi:hypothetical protein